MSCDNKLLLETGKNIDFLIYKLQDYRYIQI